MKPFYTALIIIILNACGDLGRVESTDTETPNLLHDVVAFTTDSMVNVVIEIPAGTNQKWEVDKETGQIEWERITSDSFRVVNYLAYPANYGFVPQTLLREDKGGDGDPVDVFVLGEHIERGSIVTCRIIGLIEMTDSGQGDGKLIALPVQSTWEEVNSLEALNHHYPGVLDILQTWLSNNKVDDRVIIQSVINEEEAIRYLKAAHNDYIDLKTK